MTLRQVCADLAARGELLPPSTLCRIEHGKLEPSVRRLFLLLDCYGRSPEDLLGVVRPPSGGNTPPASATPSPPRTD